MVKVGVHVSIAGSLDRAVDRAEDAGCDVFQIFSRNPRGWRFAPLPKETITAFRNKILSAGIIPVDHMPYLPNLASADDQIYEKSVQALAAELVRCGELQIPFLVTHLGHHGANGPEEGRTRVITGIRRALKTAGNDVMLLLENTAGEKNSVGSRFVHIGIIRDGLKGDGRVGVCLDTCHAFAAGYELRTESGLSGTLAEFDEEIGIEHLRIIHLNDSRGELGSGLDRHEHIGMGSIGEGGFSNILHHPVISGLPLICETPVDERRDDRGNIATVRELSR